MQNEIEIWEEKMEKIIAESLMTLEDAPGDPLAPFRKKVIETTVKLDDPPWDVSDIEYLEDLLCQ